MLVSKNVFLDTSVIIAHHFDYSSVQLRRLEDLAKQGDAHLVTTPVVIAEVKANIRRRVDTIASELKRFKKENPIAKNFTTVALKPVSNTFDADSAYEELSAQFHDYMDRTETEIVSLELSSPAEVFDWYFKQQAPFGGGEKKHEFPDAFTVSTLENWCEQRQETLYVISGDGDLATYCQSSKRLVHLQRPAEFVDMFLKQTAAMRWVEESASNNLEQVRDAARDQFEQLGFYLDDQEGDVDEVRVQDLEVEELSLLDVTQTVARFEALVHVTFDADVRYDDTDTSIWDSEDKVSISMHTIKQKLKREFNGVVIVSIQVDDEGNFRSVSGLEFTVRDVPISVDRYGRY